MDVPQLLQHHALVVTCLERQSALGSCVEDQRTAQCNAMVLKIRSLFSLNLQGCSDVSTAVAGGPWTAEQKSTIGAELSKKLSGASDSPSKGGPKGQTIPKIEFFLRAVDYEVLDDPRSSQVHLVRHFGRFLRLRGFVKISEKSLGRLSLLIALRGLRMRAPTAIDLNTILKELKSAVNTEEAAFRYPYALPFWVGTPEDMFKHAFTYAYSEAPPVQPTEELTKMLDAGAQGKFLRSSSLAMRNNGPRPETQCSSQANPSCAGQHPDVPDTMKHFFNYVMGVRHGAETIDTSARTAAAPFSTPGQNVSLPGPLPSQVAMHRTPSPSPSPNLEVQPFVAAPNTGTPPPAHGVSNAIDPAGQEPPAPDDMCPTDNEWDADDIMATLRRGTKSMKAKTTKKGSTTKSAPKLIRLRQAAKAAAAAHRAPQRKAPFIMKRPAGKGARTQSKAIVAHKTPSVHGHKAASKPGGKVARKKVAPKRGRCSERQKAFSRAYFKALNFHKGKGRDPETCRDKARKAGRKESARVVE